MKSLVHSPYKYVQKTEKKYPTAWKEIAGFRKDKGIDLPDWPDWCYIPMAAGVAIVSGGDDSRLGMHNSADISIVSGLAAWRKTRGIYRFDEALFGKLWSRSIADIPMDTIFNLPEKCCYIEIPKHFHDDFGIVGFFVFLEYDVNHGHAEVRFLLDYSNKLVAHFIHVEDEDCEEIREIVDLFRKVFSTSFNPEIAISNVEDISEKLLSISLYLCSDDADIVYAPVNKLNKKKDAIRKVGFESEVRCA